MSLWLNRIVPIITLLTDFGHRDYFVGAIKGVILSINPAASIVDITHEIPPQDIQAAAFNLLCCYETFSTGTIHVAVVDPGVGSKRKPILIECAEQFFLGPDNGLFSWVCEREKQWRAIHLTNEDSFRHPVSNTFHGRDIFAPIAAVLSKGRSISELGEPVADIVQLESLEPKQLGGGAVEGRVIHIDRFGNCITNLRAEHLASPAKLTIGEIEVTTFRRFYAQDGSDQSEFSCVTGSAGFLEISIRNASAAAVLNAQRGQKVVLDEGR